MAHLIYGKQLNTRVIVHKVVEPSRSHAIAGDNTIAMTRFAAACHNAGLDQIHDAVSDDVTMDAEVAPIPKMTQRPIWDPAQADLQGRAVVDDRRDIAGHTLGNLADIRMNVLRDRHVNHYERIKPVEMNHALAVGARHRWIDLSDNGACNAQYCRGEIHGNTEADKAPGIRRRNLKQSHVDGQPSAGQQSRYLFQRDGHVVQLPAAGQTSHVAPEKNTRWRYLVREEPATCGSADVVRKLTNSRSAGLDSIASNRASRVRGAAHPVPI